MRARAAAPTAVVRVCLCPTADFNALLQRFVSHSMAKEAIGHHVGMVCLCLTSDLKVSCADLLTLIQ
jgi:hypothetical protein